MRCHLDFETRSVLSVKDCGGYTYTRHPSTEILCAVYRIDDGPSWLLERGDFLTHDSTGLGGLEELANDPEVIFVAHNAFFEQCVWRNIMVPRYGMPEIPIERWRCTAAKAASFSLPRDLEGVGAALNLGTQKDKEGHAVMLKLSRPRRGKFGSAVFYEPEDSPELFQRLYEYCGTDVEVESEVDGLLPELSEREQKLWFLDQKINFRGVRVDVPAVKQMMEFIEITVQELSDEFQELVDYQLEGPSQVAKFREWLSGEGCDLANLQAATVDKALAGCSVCVDGDCGSRVHRALKIRRALSKISTSKYTAMLDRMDPSDGRLRDILLYYAAITGRWGGRGVQLHNMPRGTVDIIVAIQHIMFGWYDWFRSLYPSPMAVYSSCIRGMLIPTAGHRFFVGDFSAIEAMVLPWLAGDTDKLDIFREGRDLYCETAGAILGRTITKKDNPDERQGLGKVSELALGYAGGIGAYGSMSRNYGVDLHPIYDLLWDGASEEEKIKARRSYSSYLKRAEKNEDPDPLDTESGYAADIIKQRWRRANPKVVQYWDALENAAINAILTGQKVTVGGIQTVAHRYTRMEDGDPVGFGTEYVEEDSGQPEITYGMYGEYLLCQLPSGNCLVYPFAKVSTKDTPWGESRRTVSYRTQDSQTYQCYRKFAYGGLFAENITQAVARDLLAAAMVRVDESGYDICLHVHDEIVADVPETWGDEKLTEFTQVMAEVPEWATGIPVKVESWAGERYRK